MGAEVFTTLAKGADVAAVFKAAVEAAEYEYGHAGYTGTIAEKDAYTVIQDAPLSLDEAGALADRLIDDRDERVDDSGGPAGAIPVATRPTRIQQAPVPPGRYASGRAAVEAAVAALELAEGEQVVRAPGCLPAGIRTFYSRSRVSGEVRTYKGLTVDVTVAYGKPIHTHWLFFGWASS